MSDTPRFAPMAGAEGFIHETDDAAAYWMQGILWTRLADAEDSGGRWSMMEQVMPMGARPAPRKHVWSDETFYILDGQRTFLVNDDIKTASKAAFAMIARNTRHAFRVDSDTARILNSYTRKHGGNDRRARQTHRPAHAAASGTAAGRRADAGRAADPLRIDLAERIRPAGATRAFQGDRS